MALIGGVFAVCLRVSFDCRWILRLFVYGTSTFPEFGPGCLALLGPGQVYTLCHGLHLVSRYYLGQPANRAERFVLLLSLKTIRNESTMQNMETYDVVVALAVP